MRNLLRKTLPLLICGWGIAGTISLAEGLPSLKEILTRSVERARRYRAESVEERFSSRLVRVSDKLDGDGEVARVSFQLREKVKIGWGIVGSIGEISGEIQRRPVEGDIWLPDEIQFFLKGRVLFSSLHRRERITWSDFRNVLEVPTREPAEVRRTAGP